MNNSLKSELDFKFFMKRLMKDIENAAKESAKRARCEASGFTKKSSNHADYINKSITETIEEQKADKEPEVSTVENASIEIVSTANVANDETVEVKPEAEPEKETETNDTVESETVVEAKSEAETKTTEVSDENTEAASSPIMRIEDNRANPSKIKIGDRVIDLEKIDRDIANSNNPNQFEDQVNQAKKKIDEIQKSRMNVNQIALQPQMVRGFGTHKVDQPTVQKPKVEKAKADDSVKDADSMKEVVSDIIDNFEIVSKNKKVVPDCIDQIDTTKIKVETDPDAIPQTELATFDNEEMKSKYWFLSEVEKIAESNECKVKFSEIKDFQGNTTDMISVMTYTTNDNVLIYNPYKSFIIDRGAFYDKRVKIFLTDNPNTIIQTCAQAYALFIDGQDKKKKDHNYNLLNNIFKGGVIMIDTRSGLYTEEYRRLNTVVDLRTLPTKQADKNDRKAIVNRMLEAMKAGVYDQARRLDPYSYFEFYKYMDKSKTYLLTNKNPNGPKNLIIHFRRNDTFVGIYDPEKSIEEDKKDS